MERFKQFKEKDSKKPIIRENAIENAPEIVKEKGLGHKKDYNFEAIRELEGPIENLVWQLKEAIISGKYDAIIGDDASGRIPTLVFRKIMEARIHKLHLNLTPEEQRDALKTYFVTGSAAVKWNSDFPDRKGAMNQSNADMLKYFKSIKPNIKNKALLITEYISTGGVITGLAEALKKAGIPFDVATVVKREEYDEVDKNISSKGGRLFIGSYGCLPDIFGQKLLSGVGKKFDYYKKGRPDKMAIHVEPILKEVKEIKEGRREDFLKEAIDPKEVSKNIEMAREDATLMADRILEKVWGD